MKNYKPSNDDENEQRTPRSMVISQSKSPMWKNLHGFLVGTFVKTRWKKRDQQQWQLLFQQTPSSSSSPRQSLKEQSKKNLLPSYCLSIIRNRSWLSSSMLLSSSGQQRGRRSKPNESPPPPPLLSIIIHNLMHLMIVLYSFQWLFLLLMFLLFNVCCLYQFKFAIGHQIIIKSTTTPTTTTETSFVNNHHQHVHHPRKLSFYSSSVLNDDDYYYHHQSKPPSPHLSNITDLIVNIGENVILECTNEDDIIFHHDDVTSYLNRKIIKKQQQQRLKNRILHDKLTENSLNPIEKNDGSNVNDNGRKLSPIYRYRWCRYEEQRQAETVKHQTMVDNDTIIGQNDYQSSKQQKKSESCFEGDRYLLVNENHISTIIYRCEVHLQQPNSNPSSMIISRKLFKLYVDQFVREQSNDKKIRNKRAIHEFPSNGYRGRLCRPPRCKPYATVKYAQCSRIELSILYPSQQYGYNHSIDHWGTIHCNDHIVGYQLWLIGYGIVKKFLPNDQIILDNLIPGKRYCFNGWAYNSCGPGPVFTLEGVCAQNNEQCHSTSDEHCELDLDYSW